MKRILRIGMDVHSTNYTLCAIEPRFDGDDIIYANVKVTPDPDNIVQFIENLKKKIKEDCDILCGYEAGCAYDCPVSVLWRIPMLCISRLIEMTM